jgi:hypothetical protein
LAAPLLQIFSLLHREISAERILLGSSLATNSRPAATHTYETEEYDTKLLMLLNTTTSFGDPTVN